jgi:hypothetical protein
LLVHKPCTKFPSYECSYSSAGLQGSPITLTALRVICAPGNLTLCGPPARLTLVTRSTPARSCESRLQGLDRMVVCPLLRLTSCRYRTARGQPEAITRFDPLR